MRKILLLVLALVMVPVAETKNLDHAMRRNRKSFC